MLQDLIARRTSYWFMGPLNRQPDGIDWSQRSTLTVTAAGALTWQVAPS